MVFIQESHKSSVPPSSGRLQSKCRIGPVKQLCRGATLLTAVIGAALFKKVKAADNNTAVLADHERIGIGLAPEKIANVPTLSAFPDTPFSFEIRPSDYFTDSDSAGFDLRAVEKSSQALPNWINFDLGKIHFLTAYGAPDAAYAVEVIDNLAYMVGEAFGLMIINVNDPKAPILLGSYPTLEDGFGLAVVDNYAYIADGTAGLQIVDVSDPTVPSLIATYDTPGEAKKVQVVGNLAYIADDSGGLQIIDVSNPNSPTFVGSFATADDAWAVFVEEDLAFVPVGNPGLQIIDVSNPANPTLSNTYDTGYTLDVTIDGNFAYVFGSSGLITLDVNNRTHPIPFGELKVQEFITKIRVVDDLLYASEANFGLEIIDISDPKRPTLKESLSVPGGGNGLDLVDSFIYICGESSGLQILEKSYLLTGIPREDDIGNSEFQLIAEDQESNLGTSTFTLRVEGPPRAANPISNQLIDVGSSFNFFLDQTVFPDPNDDVIYHSAKGVDQIDLPSWLGFSTIGIFSGFPTSADVGQYEIFVEAFDGTVLTRSNNSFILTVDHFPIPFSSLPNQAANIGQFNSFSLPKETFVDQDQDDILTYSAVIGDGDPLPPWLDFQSESLQFSGTPSKTDEGSIEITVTATDTPGATASTTFNLAVGYFPTLSTPIPDQLAAIGNLYQFTIPANSFTAPPEETLTYSATKNDGSALPSWLSFVGPRLEFQGTPHALDRGVVPLQVIAKDSKGGTVKSLFDLNIANALLEQTVRIGGSFLYAIPNDMITSPLGPVNYSVTLNDGSPLPSWLNYTPSTLTISGVPPAGSDGIYSILIKADDGLQKPALGALILRVGPNAAPELANPISSKTAQVGQKFSYAVPSNTFSDPNGETLNLRAQRANKRPLPTWLTFTNNTLKGAAAPSDTATFGDKLTRLQICASDGDQEVCSDFDLTVQGSSNIEIILAVLGPLATLAGLSVGWYKKRGLILNPWYRKTYDMGTKFVPLNEPFKYTFKAPQNQIEQVKAFKGKRVFAGLPTPKKLDEKGLLDWLKYDLPITGGNPLPSWLSFHDGSRELISKEGPDQKHVGLYTVRAFGPGEVILEEIKLAVGELDKKIVEMEEL